jgi:sortase (surface protein transpeptidase)
MILNNIILIIVLLILANYLSKGTIITIVLKYIEILKNIIFIKEDDKTCKFDYNKEDNEDIHEDESGNEENESENQEDTENTLKLNTLNISESLSISDINYSNL